LKCPEKIEESETEKRTDLKIDWKLDPLRDFEERSKLYQKVEELCDDIECYYYDDIQSDEENQEAYWLRKQKERIEKIKKKKDEQKEKRRREYKEKREKKYRERIIMLKKMREEELDRMIEETMMNFHKEVPKKIKEIIDPLKTEIQVLHQFELDWQDEPWSGTISVKRKEELEENSMKNIRNKEQ
jgi:hypothetical protein